MYRNLRAIAWNVIGWGGIGSVVSGLAVGELTTWGIFRQGWAVPKLVLTVLGVLFGMFYLEEHMLIGLKFRWRVWTTPGTYRVAARGRR
jgi:hypothetical protein